MVGAPNGTYWWASREGHGRGDTVEGMVRVSRLEDAGLGSTMRSTGAVQWEARGGGRGRGSGLSAADRLTEGRCGGG